MSAVAELQRRLTIVPPRSAASPQQQNPATVALAALEALRDSGDESFLFWRVILELATTASTGREHEELMFHCITGCRSVLLHRWSTYSVDFRQTTRDYLFGLGLQTQQQSRTIRSSCFTASASFWKRQWNETVTDNNNNDAAVTRVRSAEQAVLDQMKRNLSVCIPSKQALFQYLEGLLLGSAASATHTTAERAATFLSILCGEFVGKSTGVPYHLPLEFHKMAHKEFERHWLGPSLRLSMGSLSQLVGSPTSETTALTLAVMQLSVDIVGWQFGSDAWDVGIGTGGSSRSSLISPPASWRDYLLQPDFVHAMFRLHSSITAMMIPNTSTGQQQQCLNLAHVTRQLILQLASLQGPIFGKGEASVSQRLHFCTILLEGVLEALRPIATVAGTTPIATLDEAQVLDWLSILTRIVSNFQLILLVKLPQQVLHQMLHTITTTGTAFLQAHVREWEEARGDVDGLPDSSEFHEAAIRELLDCTVLLCSDSWLHYTGTPEARSQTRAALSQALSPLYEAFVQGRLRMAKLEEHFLMTEALELDEVREEIAATELEEEMASVATMGRLNMGQSLAVLARLFSAVRPQLQSLWSDVSSPTGMTADASALLEEVRLLVLYLGWLLTDDHQGETPVIPEAIQIMTQNDGATTLGQTIESAVQSICQIAELQASKIAERPSDPRLSPLLATAFLWFLNRWAPAYILPIDYGSNEIGTPSPILFLWGNENQATTLTAVRFCTQLCLYYHCGWPQEGQVQEKAASLLTALAKRGKVMRSILVAQPSFQQIASLHCHTANLRHNSTSVEVEQAVAASSTPFALVQGYQRLPYKDRSHILTALLLSTCEESNTSNTTTNNTNNAASAVIFAQCLNSVQAAFSSLIQALESNAVSADDMNSKEMTLLCVELLDGIAKAGEIDNNPGRIPHFMTPMLSHLSGLMKYYAKDLSICEALLRLFRDYTEHFIVALDKGQSLILFQSSGELLQSYSSQHCSTGQRQIKALSSAEAISEEEQAYGDVLSAIELLIHLGTKDFLDLSLASANEGVDSQQVTDIIFYGLQQIIPLMTSGLLQFPTLCTQYFNLVGFMMNTYADKVCLLQYELFDALLESLLFGMSYQDEYVAKSSLQGISGIVREHLQHKALGQHLSTHPDILDKCSRRLLQEVVFQTIIWDRLEPSGMALLPLAAVDVHRFAAVVQGLTVQLPSVDHQARLQSAFSKLVQPEVLAKVASNGGAGYEGRMNRMKFKASFEAFVKEVHAFLVVR